MCISRNVSEAAASAVTTCLVALALAHIVYLANAWWFVDVAAVAYPYESPPGYLAVVLQGGVMIYFGRTLARGVREEASPTRRRFLLQVLSPFSLCVLVCVSSVSLSVSLYAYAHAGCVRAYERECVRTHTPTRHAGAGSGAGLVCDGSRVSCHRVPDGPVPARQGGSNHARPRRRLFCRRPCLARGSRSSGVVHV